MFVVRNLRIVGLPPLDFSIPRGAVLAISGPSGSGKTRLLRALADLDAAPGEVSLDGTALLRVPGPAWRRRVGLLPAEPRFWAPTVADHFPEPPSTDLLRKFGLPPEIRNGAPRRLSTGERARLAILRLLAHEPEVLLLDEPTANLDAANRDRIVRYLADWRRARRAPVVWASHTAPEIAAADQVLVLPGGRVEPGA